MLLTGRVELRSSRVADPHPQLQDITYDPCTIIVRHPVCRALLPVTLKNYNYVFLALIHTDIPTMYTELPYVPSTLWGIQTKERYASTQRQKPHDPPKLHENKKKKTPR